MIPLFKGDSVARVHTLYPSSGDGMSMHLFMLEDYQPASVRVEGANTSVADPFVILFFISYGPLMYTCMFVPVLLIWGGDPALPCATLPGATCSDRERFGRRFINLEIWKRSPEIEEHGCPPVGISKEMKWKTKKWWIRKQQKRPLGDFEIR